MFKRFGFILLILFACVVFAQAEITKTSVGISMQQLQGETAWGTDVALPFNGKAFIGHGTMNAQAAGSIIRGHYHLEVGKSVNGFDIVVYNDGSFKGYNLRDLGRQSDLGVAIEAPESNIGTLHVTGGAGIFGRNAGMFGPPNAYDQLEGLGYDPNVLDGYPGLADLTPAPSGLSFKAGNSLNLLLYAEAQHPSGVRAKLSFLPELAGEGSNPVHGLIFSPSGVINVRENVTLNIGADFRLQTFNDEIETEIGTRVTGNFVF